MSLFLRGVTIIKGDTMNGINLKDLVGNYSDFTLTAAKLAQANEEMQRTAIAAGEAKRRHDAKLEEGAEASIEQKRLLEEQIAIVSEQNVLLNENYNKLKEMYDNQVETNNQARVDLEKSREFSKWMMAISIIAMLAAVASPIVSFIVAN